MRYCAQPVADSSSIQKNGLPSPAESHSSSPVAITTTRSFYRRPLPDSCMALSSLKGKEYFASAFASSGLACFFPLIEQHSTQSEPAYCGLSTLVIALNALSVDPRRAWKGPWRWYEETMLNCCLDLQQVQKTGITLQIFNCLAICQGLQTRIVYADNCNKHNNDEALKFEECFRRNVQEACMEKKSNENSGDDETSAQILERVLIVSYDRQVLGQTGSGHFSPIAAYDPQSDVVLILDTARFKYGAHWVPLSLLAQAMEPIDPDTGRSRGFVMLNNPETMQKLKTQNSMNGHSLLPVSILLRSDFIQNTARLEFKSYLKERRQQQQQQQQKEITYQDVAKFWTKDGTDPGYIWQLAQPHFLPYEDDMEQKDYIHQVRLLIQQIDIDSVNEFRSYCPQIVTSVNDCRSNRCRTLPLSPEEVVMITYLACLDESTRHELIWTSDSCEKDEKARHQLLAEAELLRYAIDASDQIETAVSASTKCSACKASCEC